MIDLQAIHTRDVLPLQNAGILAVVRAAGDYTDAAKVSVRGQSARFVVLTTGVLIVPPDGVSAPYTAIRVEYTDGRVELLPDSTTLDQAFVLRLEVSDTTNVTEVRVNGQKALHTVLGPTQLAAELPVGIRSLDNIDVIGAVKGLSRTTFFSYLLPDEPKSVTGLDKMIGQYVKLLMTAPGSDVLHPSDGGGLRALTGGNVTLNGKASLAARVVQAVSRSTAQYMAGQVQHPPPAEERLASVSVSDVTVPPDDPTSVSISLKVSNFARQQALFSLTVGTALGAS